MKSVKIVTLATAYIKDTEGKLLLLQRGKKSSLSGRWQFAEGKLEIDELPEAALKREISEELSQSIDKAVFKTVSPVVFDTPETVFFILRIVYIVELVSHKIQLSDEHVEYDWFTEEEISNLSLVPGVSEVIAAVG